jgi:hypothetical protein
MDIKEFNQYTDNLEAYSASEVKEFEFMTDEELKEYQIDLEEADGGNISTWDHIRALFTMKKKVLECGVKLNV